MKNFVYYLIIISFIGCGEGPSLLEKVLVKNPSLSLVLQRYESDSLKYRAAEYLIENIYDHYGYKEECIAPYLKLYELFGTGRMSIEAVQDSVRRLYGKIDIRRARIESDIYISPDYLFENIEWAFKVWREQPWGKNISFADFCEYILPYRLKDEPLKSWREKVYSIFNPLLDSIRELPEAADPLFAARVLLDSVSKHPFYFSSFLGSGPHVGPDLVDWSAGNCREAADRLIYIFRAVGIPCGCDYMPLRGDANVAHYWNFVLDKYGDSYFMYDSRHPEPVRQYWGIKSKVYRQTFSINKEILEGLGNNVEKLHPDFVSPHYVDVTRLYSGRYARTLSIASNSLFRIPANGIVYLCGASWQEWVPLAVAHITKDSLFFKDVEGGVVFLLAIYENGKMIPVSDPFEFNKETGGVFFFHVQSGKEEVKLLNKYHQFVESFPQRMINGVFEGSNTPNFYRKDTLSLISELPLRLNNVIYPRASTPYRYVRYYGPANAHCNISEFAFYSSCSDSIALKGHVIGTPNGYNGDGKHEYTNAYDGDPYTSFDYYLPSGGWVGLDLGCPYTIKKIIFTPRNRDNYIRKDDEYELYYFEQGKWVSVGRQIATSDSLLYVVPQNSLLYLKNCSRGSDERIFEYSEGKQIYW
ncbi:hypothetical protein [Bacteroides heparinolyticus]|uniref:hypothetical protein n=1 Tax=Prevotella heparinolytica TaxID=28113 RepID=UPI0035A11179